MRRTGIKMKAKNIEMKKTRNPVPSSSIQVSGYLFYPSLFIMFTSYPTNSSTMDITCESILLQVSNALTSDTILVLFYITSKNKSVTFLGIILFLDLCNTSFFSFFYHSFLGISICLFSSIVLSIWGNSILLLFLIFFFFLAFVRHEPVSFLEAVSIDSWFTERHHFVFLFLSLPTGISGSILWLIWFYCRIRFQGSKVWKGKEVPEGDQNSKNAEERDLNSTSHTKIGIFCIISLNVSRTGWCILLFSNISMSLQKYQSVTCFDN